MEKRQAREEKEMLGSATWSELAAKQGEQAAEQGDLLPAVGQWRDSPHPARRPSVAGRRGFEHGRDVGFRT